MVPSITTIIHFCSNDYRFLKSCIESVRPFSKEILVVISTHFFDGEKEDETIINQSIIDHPDVQFIEFPFNEKEPFGLHCSLTKEDERWIHHWHSTSRYVGAHFAKGDFLLFVDVDEIVETDRFIEWLQSGALDRAEAFHLASYVYYKNEAFRKEELASCCLLIKKESIDYELILSDHERPGIFFHFQKPKESLVLGIDKRPMVHHYSFARPYDELIKKVLTWGHKGEKDWLNWLKRAEWPNLVRVEPKHNFSKAVDRSLACDLKREDLKNFMTVSKEKVMKQKILLLSRGFS